MGEEKEKEKKDFKHIVRLIGTDVDGKKCVGYALRKIKGIGTRTARVAAHLAGIPADARIGELGDEEVENLEKTLKIMERRAPEWMLNRRKDFYTGSNRQMLGSDWLVMIREDIDLMKRIKSYKGVRHEFGYKVRGQRTRSTGRKGAVVGVARKKIAKEKERKERGKEKKK